jgi:hypothetical protein
MKKVKVTNEIGKSLIKKVERGYNMKFIDQVRIIESDMGDMCYIKDWLPVQGLKNREELKNDMLCEGNTEEEIEEEWDSIWEKFEDWCNNNDLIAQEV